MILPIKFKADWAMIALSKQARINQSNKKENSKRIPHEYKVRYKVLLEKTWQGPEDVRTMDRTVQRSTRLDEWNCTNPKRHSRTASEHSPTETLF